MDGGRQLPVIPSPPMAEADRLARLRLLRSRRVGIATYNRLMAEHGSAARALDALPEVARAAGMADYAPCPERVIAAELRAARKAGAWQVWQGAPDYPAALNDLDDAPPMLWALGRADLLAGAAIGVVGARNASSLGLRMARQMAGDLGAAGQIVVSGLARGIDAAAHDGALDTGTIAVVGGGVDEIYPRENADLRARIAEAGVILSEQPMGLAPMARHFPRRNRLISGLARAVVVIEAAARSGSLMTARTALDQGREVMAVPGHPMDGRAGGTNILIRDGAMLVRSAQDVLEGVPPATPESPPSLPPEAPVPADMAALRLQILERLNTAPLPENDLLRALPAPAADITATLIDMELAGEVLRHGGGMLSRA